MATQIHRDREGERMTAHFKCSRCGGIKFTSYAQTIPTDGREWDYQYCCMTCGKMMFLTRAEPKEEE